MSGVSQPWPDFTSELTFVDEALAFVHEWLVASLECSSSSPRFDDARAIEVREKYQNLFSCFMRRLARS
jgi:hypothetical protein